MSSRDVEADSGRTTAEDNGGNADGVTAGAPITRSRTRAPPCCRSCVACLRKHFPRTAAILIGVVFPLFMIIGFSTFFGYFLARLEADNEKETNNQIIRTRLAMQFLDVMGEKVAEDLPYICACTFLKEENQTLAKEGYAECLAEEEKNLASASGEASNATSNCVEPTDIDIESLSIELLIQQVFIDQYQCNASNTAMADLPLDQVCSNATGFTNTEASVNPSDLLASLNDCGEAAYKIVEAYKFEDIIDPELVASDVTFNWIRCSDEYEIEDLASELFVPFANHTRLLPSVQEDKIMQAFEESQSDLYCDKLKDELEQETTDKKENSLVKARLEALKHSISQANGFDECTVNTYAGGWFWFTIATTIGYGNTAPVTVGGRAMVFTLGFFSLLFFAAFLASSGVIVVAIVDDWLKRLKLSCFTWPSIQAFVWGALYYLWSYVIAVYYVFWNESRMGEEVEQRDAYWFAYMSTSTIGLGDFHLNHAVINSHDLIAWPLLILFGFVLLSSFLNKLGELIHSFFPRKQQSIEEILATDTRPMFRCCPTWFQRDDNADWNSINDNQSDASSQHVVADSNITPQSTDQIIIQPNGKSNEKGASSDTIEY